MHGNRPITVLSHGCFDLLHIGHIRHLQEARALGDRLVVSVTPDEHVAKGMNRPHFTAQERVEALKALDCVDDAFIAEGATAANSITAVAPAIYVKGVDYANSSDEALQAERALLESLGGKFHITKAAKVSSSRLLNATRLSEKVVAYLNTAKSRGFLDKIKQAFAAADKLKLALIGESIIDEYRYVRGLGKPSKEFILATVQETTETFDGGVEAAAKHCDWPNVQVVTAGTAIFKTRFVDRDFNRKLFEVYSHSRVVMTPELRAQFNQDIGSAVENSDAVIVFDFGHGLLDPIQRLAICESSKFLAVNAQTNAGNVGFNPVTLYQKASLVCVDEPEARLAATAQTSELDLVAPALMGRVDCKSLIITKGRNGCLCHETTDIPIYGSGIRGNNNVKTMRAYEKIAEIPAFVTGGIDTIGAGDAFLATAAPLVAAGLELEAAAFVGNVAGAIKTTIVGHRQHVGRDELMQTVEALLA